MIKVLIIDESQLVGRTLKRGLERKGGYWVLASTRVRTGLRLGRRFGPDCILLDMDLQQANPFDVLKRLRATARTQYVPVIAMSTSNDDALRREVAQAYVEQCLVKPFRLDKLRSAIERTMMFRGVPVDADADADGSVAAA